MSSFYRNIRSKPTIVLATVCAILLAAVITTSLIFAASARSVSLEDVTAEVTTGVDDLQDQLPTSAVDKSTDITRTEPCPDGSAGELIRLTRTVTTVAGFDAPQWVRELSGKYNATEGWSARLRTGGASDHLTLTLVDRKLMLYTLATGSSGEKGQLTIGATSRCSTK
ncbi:hypothetical protein B7R21_18610 [Subtercola boreus]|uniref:Uncharacterized protein n=1 Tax=Subtercola boreus TaxID=120213 RepID=A0A3E0VAB0_9MICO|nr:hypothetical protein [Subtercola boreus]RFA06786.1 hypothetical protein B7R21_18610 [Subtercola boreus]